MTWRRTQAPSLEFPAASGRRANAGRRNIMVVLYSPASAMAFSMVGYYSLAGYVNAFMPEGSLGATLIRSGILAVIFLAIFFAPPFRAGSRYLALAPAIAFLLAYLLRLVENIFFSGIFIPPGAETLFSIFIAGGIVPALALSRMSRGIGDRDTAIVMSFLCVCFLGGMALNLDLLVSTKDSRMMLDKMNPISMAQTATAFFTYYLVYWNKSKRLSIEAALFMPLLLLIVIYARSRGVYIAGVVSILVYILLLTGTRRVWMGLGMIALAVAFVSVVGADVFDTVWKRLQSSDIYEDESTRLHYAAAIGAWGQFLTDFLFGNYAIELTTGLYPHNIFLESLMSVGLLGSFPLAAHVILAIRSAVGIIRTPAFPAAAVFISLLFIQESCIAATAGSLWGSSGFWIASMLTIAFWHCDLLAFKDVARPAMKLNCVAVGRKRFSDHLCGEA